MNPPQPDPRIFEKNFGMPMNPASVGESSVGPVRRKDGLPAPAPSQPSQPEWGGQPGQPSTIRNREFNDVPPLLCKLFRKADGTRAITVTEGGITEIIPKTGTGVDGVVEHEISGIWQGTLLKEHAIETGQSIGVAFEVDEEGYIKADPAPAIVVRPIPPDTEVSAHYIPPVGDDLTGSAGGVYIILARLTGTGNSERLVVNHGGSNVQHVHDLLPFVKAGGTHDIFEKFDGAIGKFKTYGLTAGDGITLTKSGGQIEIAASGGENLNLEVYVWTFEYDGLGALQATESTSPVEIHYWRNGLYVGNLWTDDPPLDPPANVRAVSYNTF